MSRRVIKLGPVRIVALTAFSPITLYLLLQVKNVDDL